MTSKVAEVGPNKAGFVFGESKDEGPNKVIGAIPVEAFLTQYIDGNSKKCVRLVFKAPGTKDAFILQERIQGSYVATAAAAWFNEAFFNKLIEKGFEKTTAKEGKEGAEAL